MTPAVTLVTGPAGVGKTAWIGHYLSQHRDPHLYFGAGSGSLPIDGMYLASLYPHLRVLIEGQEEDLLIQLRAGIPAIVEVGFHLDPIHMQGIFGDFECRWIGLTPNGEDKLDAYLWADELVPGQPVLATLEHPHLWRAPLAGYTWDPERLATFWDTLLQGEFGELYRVKGLFALTSGQTLYGDYTVEGSRTFPDEFLALPTQSLARLTESGLTMGGLEVLGRDLDRGSLRHAVLASCQPPHA
ncbi:MAG: hypothetical protein OHK0012_13690 [Synechococcales cyanobacterium]